MENNFKCRTCLAIGNEREICTRIGQVVHSFSQITYKDILVQLVPQMEATLVEDDLICASCKRVLKTVIKFIDHCLVVEAKLTEDLDRVNTEEEPEESVVVPIEDLDGMELEGPAEVVENIEIVVEGNLQQLLNKSNTEEVGHDHAYIKNEYENELEEGEVVPEPTTTASNAAQLLAAETDDDATMDMGYELTEQEEEYQLLSGAEQGMEPRYVDENETEDHSQLSENSVYIKQEMEDESKDVSVLSDQPMVLQDGLIGICEVCGKEFRNISQINKHLASHQNKQAKCPECPKIFKTEMYLNRHINLVHEPDALGVRYLCAECDKLFKNKAALNAHYKLKHLKLEPFKCEICMETFGRADYLKKHLNQHFQAEEKEKKMSRGSKIPGKFMRFKNTDFSDEPLPCKICGKYYNGIHKLKVHLQTHVVVKRYACDYCDLTYKRWPSLKRHEKTHLEADGKFFRCNVCWKRLPTEEELQVHMTQHGNPRYRCHICSQQFHRKYLFDNHYLLVHATPEDLELSKKEVIYDTLLELANQSADA